MRKFDEVHWFSSGSLTIYFPEDDICCGHCPLCYEDNMKRPRCSFDNHLVYSKEHISPFCRLVFDRDINEPVEKVEDELLGVKV